MPGDIMEKLYDHEAAERLEEEKRLSEKKVEKETEKKAKKVSRYVLESDSGLTESFWMTVGERKVALVSQTFKVQMKKTL